MKEKVSGFPLWFFLSLVFYFFSVDLIIGFMVWGFRVLLGGYVFTCSCGRLIPWLRLKCGVGIGIREW